VRLAVGERWAIASGCAEATRAAAACLEAGGNVVDAAMAGSAVLCVVLPHAASVGGDLFALVRQGPSTDVVAVNASGGAPRRATIEAYRRLGHARVPRAGGLSVEVPGLVAGWQVLHERWGSRPLATVLEPAITFARHGSLVGPRLARAIAVARGTFARSPAWAALFMRDGRALRMGDRLVQPALAHTLERIAASGAAGFYSGPVARDLARTVREDGGLLEEDDLTHVRADTGAPLALRYRDVEILTQPPVSQGAVLLRSLGLLAAAAPRPDILDEPELWLHAVAGVRRALDERLALLGDGEDARAVAEAMIEGRAAPRARTARLVATPGSETTALAVQDASGNAVALIQSVYADLGSGVVGRDSGVLLNNRLSAFFLDPAHPNGLAPGRRTMHTLHTFMVRDAAGIRWAGGSPGGDHQPQVNLQVLVRLLDRGQSPTAAVAAPRWAITPRTDPHDLAQASSARLQCEVGTPEGTLRRFAEAGFDVDCDPALGLGSAKLVGRGPRPASVAAYTDRRREATVMAR
jgi:gamma-glutamyltranspeptidase/glutathione hydrolase